MKLIATFAIIGTLIVTAGCVANKETKDIEFAVASTSGNLQSLKELVDKENINLNKQLVYETTPFGYNDNRPFALAYSNGMLPVAKILIKNGADPNSMLSSRISYLHASILNAEIKYISLLLENGANPNIVSKLKVNDKKILYRPLDYLLVSQHYYIYYEEIINILVNNGAQIDVETLQFVLGNTKYKGEAGVSEQKYLMAPIILNKLDQQGSKSGISQALEFAIRGENKKLIKEIRERRIPENERDLVLFFAAASCETNVLSELKMKNYDFKIKDENQMSLLQVAAMRNSHQDTIKFLISEGLDIEYKNGDGTYTSLSISVLAGNKIGAKILKENGAKFQTELNKLDDINIWEEACGYGDSNSLKILAELNYTPTEQEMYAGLLKATDKTFTTLMNKYIPVNYEKKVEIFSSIIDNYAVSGDERKVMALYQNGAKVTKETLYYACSSYCNTFVRAVIEKKEIIIDKGVMETALAYAIDSGNFEMVKYLIKKGANPNELLTGKESEEFHEYYVDWRDEITPVHVASVRPSRTILNYIIQNGGDAKVKSKRGVTPLKFARKGFDFYNLKKVVFEENIKLLIMFSKRVS
ncbi:MAG: ankyrin repeat domain-containing protein [Anaerovoracaceae bacterium]